MAEVVARHGPWRSHNLEVAEGVFTIGPEETGDEVRLQRFRAASDALLGPPGPGMRVLDLGCGEGLYAVDYARRGAEVLGLELREANLARARLAQWALDLPRLRLERQDVRGLLPAELGRFDLVICSGLLYHLDTPDLFDLVERIAAVTGRLALFDTRIALDSVESRVWRGEAYAGLVYREHEPESDAATRLARAGSSYPNEKSFWLTHHALVTLLERSGFRTVMQLHAPPYRQPRPDRITLVALP